MNVIIIAIISFGTEYILDQFCMIIHRILLSDEQRAIQQFAVALASITFDNGISFGESA